MDDRSIGSIPGEIFASHGKKHPAVVTTLPTFSGMSIRRNLFAYTCRSRGMEEPMVYCCKATGRSGYETTLPLLKAHPETDCILYMREDLALGSLRVFSELAIPFPGNLEFIAIGDSALDFSEVCAPSLSVVSLPLEAVAAECTRIMHRQIHASGCGITSKVMPVTYIPRESCPNMR